MNKSELLSLADNLGFDAVGVSRPEPKKFDAYQKWIEQGYHGEMGYLAKRAEARRDPDFVLPNIRSVIVVAKRYLSVEPAQPTPERPFAAVVSRYAWGQDYHEVMGESLKKLCDEIHSRTGGVHQARWCVDTAPVLEKDFAAQAGIGWVGKHSNLLSRSLGNWFFLGAVLTTLDLEPDTPAQSHCGTCRRCLDACPTQAFISPYVLDARRCISYLTIELKGSIPRELRPLMGQRIYGCDDCLAVCPWNRFALPTPDERFHPRHNLHTADLIELMQMDNEGFRRMFKGSPIKRTKRRGLLRNVAVALGNTGDERTIPVLANALTDKEALIRAHAAWALGRIGGDEARRILKQALENETDDQVWEEINWALSNLS